MYTRFKYMIPIIEVLITAKLIQVFLSNTNNSI